MLSGKNILIGITGGIAAYKICELIRMFKRQNANVRVICTPNALSFVTKLTLQNLSRNEVGVEEFEIPDFKPEHISYADEADIMVIAPATANTIGKIANGICDNLLTSVVCAFKKPVIIAPAMNCNMWENLFVQENIKKLAGAGYKIIEPESGFLACGYEGKGRLCSLDKIFEETASVLATSPLRERSKFCTHGAGAGNAGESLRKYVITAGGTIEDIDPVRFISNYSSGKMGLALADEAYAAGNEVVLITTKEVERPYKVVMVKSALDMQTAVNDEFETANVIIMAAAVADYRVKNKSEQKIKKTSDDEITLELVKNPDILKGLCERKLLLTCCSQSEAMNLRVFANAQNDVTAEESLINESSKKQPHTKVENISDFRSEKPIIVGFCAESENLLENAKEKIQKKGCDFLIANDISRTDIGFSSDYNEVTILKKDGEIKKLQRAPKTEIARQIMKYINA